MKTSLKFLVPLLALTFSLAPLTRAADETPAQTPMPSSPDSSDSSTNTKAKGRARGQAMEQMKEMKEKLSLTADQETKIKEIYKSHMAELRAAKGDRPAMADLIQKQRAEVRAVLTPDQQTKFDSMAPAAGAHGKKKKDKSEA